MHTIHVIELSIKFWWKQTKMKTNIEFQQVITPKSFSHSGWNLCDLSF